MKAKGKVWKYGKNIDTDVIYPSKYLVHFEPEEVAKHAMEGLDPDFKNKVKPGDILVAETNFGCGSAREQAAMALKYAGLGAIVAESFSRAFYRNAINNGLPILEVKGISEAVKEGDTIEVDFAAGEVKLADGRVLKTAPLPEFILDIIKAGGMVPYYNSRK